MLSVPEQLKNILKNDRFPMADTSVPKDLEITFNGVAPIHADQVVDDSFSLTESIIADDDIRFGTCRASQIKFKLASVPEELKGREFTIDYLIGNEYVIPLGKYKVQSAKLQDDLIFKEVVAYDKLKDTDADVSSWYNGLFPTGNETYTLKQFRSSLLAYLGIEEIDQTLPNDDMVVEKTIDPTQISGRTVLEATVELNGAFGNINRFGKFRRIILQPGYGDYPTNDYPQMDYPVSETDTSYLNENLIDETIGKSMYQSVRFEEYTVKEIDKLQIRAEENDIGAIVGGDQRRVIDTQIGSSIQSTKSDDSVVEITKIEGATYQNVTVQGRNICPTNFSEWESGWYNSNTGKKQDYEKRIRTKRLIGVKPSSVYYCNTTSTIFVLRTYNASGIFVRSIGAVNNGATFTTSADEYYIGISLNDNVNYDKFKSDFANGTLKPFICLNSESDKTYEPFTPNSPSPDYPSPIVNAKNFDIIASNGIESNQINIPYELCSLPNGVADTRERLDDKYVKYTHRIKRRVFDGSEDENWEITPSVNPNSTRFILRDSSVRITDSRDKSILCDKLKSMTWREIYETDITTGNGISTYDQGGRIVIRIEISKLATQDVAGFKAFLQANPVTTLYELATPAETIVEEPSTLTSYKGITNITTNANPQVSLTADFCVNPINTYVIEGNFLVFGKSAGELETIAMNAFGNMAKRPYRPYEAQSIGLPYVEVGDSLEYSTDDVVHGYVLQRTLTGIQSLWDEIEAPGSEEREQNFGVNKEIIQLQGKVTRIKKDVEGISIEVEDLAQDTASKFEQTAQSISAEVTRSKGAEETLSGSIDVLAGQVVLKVDTNGKIALVELDADPDTGTTIQLSADNINLQGYVTITSLETPGSVEIDGGNLKAGTVIADEVRADWVYAGTISGDKINGGTISGVKIVSTGGSGTTSIYNGGVTSNFIYSDALSAGTISVGSNVNIYGSSGTVSATNGNFTKINDYTPVTSGNIGNHTAGHATTAGYAEESHHAERADIALVAGSVSGLRTGQITASNTGYGNIDFLGFDNAAGVNWAQANFAPIGSSDIRLKHSVLPMDDLPDELFYELKPYQFKYKTDTYGKGIFFGLIAQQVENAFQRYGLDPYNYDLIDLKDVKAYTDDGMYVTDKTHRIHYTNFIAWLIRVVQKQNERIAYLENTIS